MQIVIDTRYCPCRTLKDECGIGNDECYEDDIYAWCPLIGNGGVKLPKGHGKLFDVNDLLDRIGLEDNESNRDENVGEIVTLEDFDYIPTIIPADAESEE